MFLYTCGLAVSETVGATTLVKCQVHDELELSQLTQLRASDLTGGSAVTDTSGPFCVAAACIKKPVRHHGGAQFVGVA